MVDGMKKALLSTLIIFLFSGCSMVNSVRMMTANDHLKPLWPTNYPVQQFDSVYIGGKPYIKIKAGTDTELLFLVDTGAAFTMLFDTEKGKRIPKKRGFDLFVSGWGEGKNTPAYQAEIEKLSIGEVEFHQVNVAYIPVSTSQYYLSKEEAIFDGVIGHDLLQHFSWTFDKRSKLITATADGYQKKEDDIVLPFDVTFRKLHIPGTMSFTGEQTIMRDFVIDTGSRHYLKLSTAFVKQNDIALPAQQITAADFGMSGMTEHKRITAHSLMLSDLMLERVKVNLIPSDDEDDWWVIGSALMNQFITVIDYHNNQFVMRPYPHHKFATQYNLAGMEIRKLKNGRFLVRYLSPGLPAHQHGLKVGDEIVSINGILAEEISEEQWLLLNSKPLPQTICLTEKRCLTYKVNHIEGYSFAP